MNVRHIIQGRHVRYCSHIARPVGVSRVGKNSKVYIARYGVEEDDDEDDDDDDAFDAHSRTGTQVVLRISVRSVYT